MNNEEIILEKWKDLIQACKNYYIDSIATGMLDSEYDELEKKAIKEDNFYVRDYVLNRYSKGTRFENHHITKFKKEAITGSMLTALLNNRSDYYTLKHDGSSIAIYPDPKTGVVKHVVGVGNLNLSSFGIEQSYKLLKFMPVFPKGIVAVQCEALIDLDRLPKDVDEEKARQKTNGLINSSKMQDEVDNYLTLRAYRYYTDDSPEGIAISSLDYQDVIKSFSTVYAPDGHIWFAPAEVYSPEELGSWVEDYKVVTPTGRFLIDGFVRYNKSGKCLGALKFSGAGEKTEALPVTIVRGIKWNDMSKKGKDSWFANVIIDPVIIHGAKITKPSAGSIKKLIENNTTPGAKVNIILANSTIPKINETLSPGNGDYQWPVCECGYKLTGKDIFGLGLKCGNPMCTCRINRMREYLSSLTNVATDLDLNKLLVIDRFKWEETDIDISKLLGYVESVNAEEYYNYLLSFLNTESQKRNLELVWEASWTVLLEIWLKNVNKK